MNSAPFYYDYINTATSRQSPSTVKVHNTELAFFFKRYLLQKAMSVFDFKFPVTWDRDYFLYTLYCWGYLAVFNTNRYGAIPQGCGLQGYNIFYRPTTAVITNPLLTGMRSLRIDVQCTIIKLQPDYGGIMDVVDYYGDMMALASETAGVNLVNSKFSYVFASGNKAGAESFKKMFDELQAGNPATVVDKNLMNSDGSPAWQPFDQNVGQNFIVGGVLEVLRTLENMYNTHIGIPNANTDKKERMIEKEVESNNVETNSLVGLWFTELSESFEKTRKMFGFSKNELSVEWKREEEKKIESNIVNNGTV